MNLQAITVSPKYSYSIIIICKQFILSYNIKCSKGESKIILDIISNRWEHNTYYHPRQSGPANKDNKGGDSTHRAPELAIHH